MLELSKTTGDKATPTARSLHSVCRWTFNPGKGGFVPADMRHAVVQAQAIFDRMYR